MKLRTDDAIWRARLVWLGPPNYSLPWEWPYARYGTLIALVAIFGGAAIAIARGPGLASVAVGVALFVNAWIWHNVDPDVPALKVVKVAFIDRVRYHTPTQTRTPRLSARHIRFSPIPATPTSKRKATTR